MSGVDANQAGQTPVDSHAEGGETGAVCPKTPSPTDIQERESIEDILHEAVAQVRSVEDAATAILALRSNPQPGSEGWKLVPEFDITDEMMAAGREAFNNDTGDGRLVELWNAMCAASPTPPTAQPGEASPATAGYGALWRMTTDNPALHEARRILLAEIGGQGSDGQRAAVRWAVENLPPVTDSEIIGTTVEPQPGEVERLLWFNDQINLELSFGYPDEEEPGVWQVHRCSGNVNDREWELIAKADTVATAIDRARAALTPKGEEEGNDHP